MVDFFSLLSTFELKRDENDDTFSYAQEKSVGLPAKNELHSLNSNGLCVCVFSMNKTLQNMVYARVLSHFFAALAEAACYTATFDMLTAKHKMNVFINHL